MLARRTVEKSHAAGCILADIKSRMNHGEWLSWLETENVPKRTAQRLIQLAGIEGDKLSHFDSVDAALKSLPSPRKPHARAESPTRAQPTAPSPPSPRDDDSAFKLDVATERAESAENELEALRERLAIVTEAAPDDWHGALDVAREQTIRERQRTADASAERERLSTEVRKLQNKLGRVKAALLRDEPRSAILAKHFGVARPAE